MWKKRGFYLLILMLGLLLCMYGCTDENTEKGQSLEFTVVAEEDLPAELKTIIEQKKTGEFKLTYIDGNYLYIAVGYGKQPTGGYSIQIPEVSLTDTNIVFKSQLLGPKGEAQANISYPFAVIKLEKRGEPVIFEN